MIYFIIFMAVVAAVSTIDYYMPPERRRPARAPQPYRRGGSSRRG